FTDEGLLRQDVGEVLPGRHRLDAGERQRLLDIDREDAGMGVRAALHLAEEHAGHRHVGAEGGATGDLVGAVGTDRAGPYHLEIGFVADIRHGLRSSRIRSSRIWAAASSTARMTLS